MQLTVAEQKKLAAAIPKAHLKMIVDRGMSQMGSGKMRGKGFLDTLKSIGETLSPVVKAIGPPIFEHLVRPYIEKKLSGQGLKLAGTTSSRGSGFTVSGGSKKPAKRKGPVRKVRFSLV